MENDSEQRLQLPGWSTVIDYTYWGSSRKPSGCAGASCRHHRARAIRRLLQRKGRRIKKNASPRPVMQQWTPEDETTNANKLRERRVAG